MSQKTGLSMSARELLDILAGIDETVLQFKTERGRRSARRMISEIDPSQRKLYEFFGLDAYAPKRRVRYHTKREYKYHG